MQTENDNINNDIFSIPCLEHRKFLTADEWAEENVILRDTGKFRYSETPWMREPTRAGSDVFKVCRVVVSTCAQCAKDLAWYTEIPTPSGFKLMRDLSVGDVVYSMDGSETIVTLKTPPQYNKMYRIHFDDGTFLDAGEEHRWLASQTSINYKRLPEKVWTTKEMVDVINERASKPHFWTRGKLRSVFAIRMQNPIEGVQKDLPIDPYILGAWLGDGNKDGGRITKMEDDLKEMFPFTEIKPYTNNKCSHVTIEGLTKKLRLNNLLYNKHIPQEYFTASFEQRLALLQGLMDTDGTVSRTRTRKGVSWTQKSDRLTQDFLILLSSLGIKYHHKKKLAKITKLNFEGYYNYVDFSTDLPVFRLNRKAQCLTKTVRRDAHWRYIREITEIPTVESYCISVAHPSHTYLAGKQFCVTHNTTAIVNVLCHQAVFHPQNSMLLLDTLEAARRIVKNRLKPALRDFGKVPSLQKGQTAHVLDTSAETTNIALASGANLICASAKSISALASTPVQLLCLDEVDRYEQELGVEGDPVILAMKRTLRYKNSMTLMTSTPTTPDGRITKHFMLGTQEVWSAVCPCGCYMPVLFDDIDFSNDVPCYSCPSCGTVYSEQDVIALPHAYAPPLNPNPFTDKNGRIARSFKVTAPLVHSAYTWESIEVERKQAEAIGLPAIRSWRNVTVGEPFTPPSVSVSNFEGLMDHRIFFDNNSIPSWIKYVITGIDTQDSRFELVVIGISEDTHTVAVIQHKIIFGDILTDFAPWNELKDFLANSRFTTQDNRTLPIALSMIDAGGHATQEVFALGLQTPYIRPVRGRCYRLGEQENSIIDKIQRKGVTQIGTGTGRVDLTWVNTRFTKDLIYYKLSEILKNRDAQLYFSANPESLIDENFFEQITSEEKYETAKGYSNYRLKVGKRNECLDCLVYSLAGAESIRLSLCKMPSVSNNLDNVQFSETVAQSKNIGKNDIMIPASIPASSLSNNDKRIIDNEQKKQDNIIKPQINHLKKKYKPL